jgi:hypothetical protein
MKCMSHRLKQIRMGAGTHKKEGEFIIILFPGHEPIRFDVAFPKPGIFSFEFMWFVLAW